MNREFVRVSEAGDIDTAVLPEDHVIMALDFEGTGTQVYAKDYRPRLAQFAFDTKHAFIFNAEVHAEYVRQLILDAQLIIVHGASYDLAVVDQCFDIPLEMTWPKTVCTMEMARLLYPTESAALKDLMRKELNAEVDSDKALRAEFKRLKLRPIAKGYELIPLDNEVFLKYAGLDAIGTFQLWLKWKDRFE